MRYFELSEFACPCCEKEGMDARFLNKLDGARHYAGVPFVITSGFRCSKHNASLLNSSPLSSHLDGIASDIKCHDSKTRWRIVFGLQAVGFQRIGVYRNHIHVDSAQDKPVPVLYLGSY